jgi:hypothetical protein
MLGLLCLVFGNNRDLVSSRQSPLLTGGLGQRNAPQMSTTVISSQNSRSVKQFRRPYVSIAVCQASASLAVIEQAVDHVLFREICRRHAQETVLKVLIQCPWKDSRQPSCSQQNLACAPCLMGTDFVQRGLHQGQVGVTISNGEPAKQTKRPGWNVPGHILP